MRCAAAPDFPQLLNQNMSCQASNALPLHRLAAAGTIIEVLFGGTVARQAVIAIPPSIGGEAALTLAEEFASKRSLASPFFCFKIIHFTNASASARFPLMKTIIPQPSGDLTLDQIMQRFAMDEDARKYLEMIRWPNGPACPHCGNSDPERIYELAPNLAKKVRPGLRHCAECKGQFTVTVGTVFEDQKDTATEMADRLVYALLIQRREWQPSKCNVCSISVPIVRHGS